MSRGRISRAVSPMGTVAGSVPWSRSPASRPAKSPTSRKSKPTSNSVPRSGLPGTTVNTGTPAFAAVAMIESITLETVVSPGTNTASAPRDSVDWIASITPDEFSTAASSRTMPRALQLARANSMNRRELLSEGLWATPTLASRGLIACTIRNVASTGVRLP